jgi:site-specific DNA-methyltransferase (adenine-specific)
MEVNKLFNENCLDTMKRMPDNFIDLTVTSPPYDNLRTYKGYEFDFESIAKELFRVTKKGGVIVWVVGDATIDGSETGTSFKQALYFKECGFNLHDTMIYYKDSPPLNHNRYEQGFEYMFILSKDKPNTFKPIRVQCNWFNKDSNREGQSYSEHSEKNKRVRSEKDRTNIKETKIKENIWKYGTGYMKTTKDKYAFRHPAVFPEKLANDHIISWSNENDIVYDPFAGSGTTLKMAILNKRQWIGSEISEEYCNIANERVSDAIIAKEQEIF